MHLERYKKKGDAFLHRIIALDEARARAYNPEMKRRFKTIPDIIDDVGRSVRTINKTGAAKGIMRLPHRWERVLHNVGEYIEGL